MTKEAAQLMAAALDRVTVGGSFSPAEVGAELGLDRVQSESAARALSNAGVLELGFDCAARFTPGYRKAHAAAGRKSARKPPRAVRSQKVGTISAQPLDEPLAGG